MALQLQFNDDTQHRINLETFIEETSRNLDDADPASQGATLLYTLDFTVKDTEDYNAVQYAVAPYTLNNSINTIKILQDGVIKYQTSRYDKINGLYLRSMNVDAQENNDDLKFDICCSKYV